MAISTVNVDFSAILQNAATATGLLRVRLSQVGTVEDSETGDTVILPIAWQETTLTDGAATLALVPNKIIEPSCTYYEIQLKSIPDCPKACAKLLLSGIMYVPDEDCNVLDLLISPPSPETANTASGYASQAKQAAQVAEYFAVQAGDRYDDVAEAAATALTDIGTAKQDALDAISTAQSGATEAISTAQGTAIGAVQAEGNTQVGRVEDAGEDAVADVTAAQATAVSAVQAQQATSIAAVTAEGTRQTGLVTAEGTAQVNAVTQAGNGYVSTMQGLVSDAQAARDAAETAQGLAEDAQEAAEDARDSAQGHAGSAAASADAAASSQSAAALSASAAAASAAGIAAAEDQIGANADAIAALEVKTDITDKRLENVRELLKGNLYAEQTDDAEAYSKTVPAGALPWASLDSIGGRTVVWNQVLPPKNVSITGTNFAAARTGSGEFVVTCSDTASNSGGYNWFSLEASTFVAGHKYVFLSSDSRFRGNLKRYVIDTDNIFEVSTALFNNFTVKFTNIPAGTYSFYIYLLDLTFMFGAGNEPATVDAFRAMFPSIDPAYNAGELMSAGVTEVESEGKNIWNSYEMTLESGSNITVLGVDSLQSSTTAYQENKNSFAVYGKSGERFSVSFDYETMNIVSTAPQFKFRFVYDDGTYTEGYVPLTSIGTKGTGSLTSEAGKIVKEFRWGGWSYTGTIKLTNIQLERGSTATAYTPYVSRTLPIPSTIQALPGYGWSAGSAYNVVSLAQGKNTQRVGKIVLDGTQPIAYANWKPSENGVGWLYPYNLTQAKPVGEYVIGNIVSDRYLPVKYNSLFKMTEVGIGIYYTTAYGFVIWQPNTSLTTVSAINAYLAANPITVYYELATPIETDISQYLSDDNLINVEAGGTLTFKNQNGDDFRLPVPNEETFLVQAAPELPTTDGTYTLQCTVTDGTPSVTWVTA